MRPFTTINQTKPSAHKHSNNKSSNLQGFQQESREEEEEQEVIHEQIQYHHKKEEYHIEEEVYQRGNHRNESAYHIEEDVHRLEEGEQEEIKDEFEFSMLNASEIRLKNHNHS